MPMKKTRREVRAMRDLATNRSSRESSQVSSERVDLRVQIVGVSIAFFLRLFASGVWRCRQRDVMPIAARQQAD